MNKLYAFVFSRKFLLMALAILSAAYIFSFHNRYIETDESWSAEHSYSFLQDGIVKLKTMPGVLNLDERTFIYHKFYTWVSSVAIYIFGISAYVLKGLTLCLFLVFIFVVNRYIKHDPHLSQDHFLIALLFLLTTPIILIQSFFFRPDVWVMAIGFTSFYFIYRFRNSRKQLFVISAGFFAGLAFLTHLNGVSFCVAGFMYLLVSKEYKPLLIFSGVAIFICAFYFIDLYPSGNFNMFIHQITNWPTVNHGENYIGGGFFGIIEKRFFKLLSEHQRFFWGERVIVFSIMFFLSLIANFKNLLRNHRDLLIYTLLLIFSLNFFGNSTAERYLLYYFGFMALIIAIWVVHLLNSKKVVYKYLVFVILALQLTTFIMRYSKIYSSSYDHVEVHAEVLNQIPEEDARILVPWEFFFNEFEKRDIYSYKTYEYFQDYNNEVMTLQEFYDMAANTYNMDYIVINKRVRSYPWFARNKNLESGYYRKVYEKDGYTILRKI